MNELADWSILGDWIGKQVRPDWDLAWGPMPLILGMPKHVSFAAKKALTAAAANYGCPMLWAPGQDAEPPLDKDEQGNYLPPEGGWKTSRIYRSRFSQTIRRVIAQRTSRFGGNRLSAGKH